MYGRPRNDYPPALTSRSDHLPDNRPQLQKIDFFVEEIKFENKRSILGGEVIAISRGANPPFPPDYIGKKSILRLPFNTEATRGYKQQVMTLSDIFAFDPSPRYQHIEPVGTVLGQAAVLIKSANYLQEKGASLIGGTIIGVGRKNSVVGKMAEGRDVLFTSFMPMERIFNGKVFFFDHLQMSFRATDAECTLHGVDMRPREDVPFTAENIAAFHDATHRAAEASQRSTKKKENEAPPKTGESGPV